MVTLPLQKEVFEQDSQVEFILNDSQSPTTHPDSSLQTEKRPEAEDKEDMENILIRIKYLVLQAR